MKGEQRKAVEFLVDGDTKAKGQLQVGSQATVAYCAAEGQNVGVHVVVSPASGLKTR